MSDILGQQFIDGQRFLRPVCYQNYPDEYLPRALQNTNPLGLNRLVDGQWSRLPLN